jgi:hypothetical protein
MSCEYCEQSKNIKINDIYNHGHIWINLDSKTLYSIPNNRWQKTLAIEIKYCPMCGREL